MRKHLHMIDFRKQLYKKAGQPSIKLAAYIFISECNQQGQAGTIDQVPLKIFKTLTIEG